MCLEDINVSLKELVLHYRKLYDEKEKSYIEKKIKTIKEKQIEEQKILLCVTAKNK